MFLFSLTICQILTGQQPFHGIKSLELALHISAGARPTKPEDAEAIGISEPLWRLIQKCWEGDNTRRPQIQEVVDGVTSAAANWHVLTPPSGTEYWEDTAEEESDELAHGEFSLFSIVPPVFRPSVQLGYSCLMRAKAWKLLARVPIHRPIHQPALGSPAMRTLHRPNQLRWKPMKSMLSPSTCTWTRITPRLLLPFLRGNAKDLSTCWARFLGANRNTKHFFHYLSRDPRTVCTFEHYGHPRCMYVVYPSGLDRVFHTQVRQGSRTVVERVKM